MNLAKPMIESYRECLSRCHRRQCGTDRQLQTPSAGNLAAGGLLPNAFSLPVRTVQQRQWRGEFSGQAVRESEDEASRRLRIGERTEQETRSLDELRFVFLILGRIGRFEQNC